MIDFEYYAPDSLIEALSLLDRWRSGAKVLAGGTDLILHLKNGSAMPSVIVDVKRIPELKRLELSHNKTLHIGAAVPISKIIAYNPVRETFGILNQACSILGSVQIRNRGTIGGNICNAAPSADTVPPLMCLGARAIVCGLAGKRSIPLEDFFRGPGQTVLEENELLVEVEVPCPPAHSAGCYLRHTPRDEMDISVIGVAAFLALSPEHKLCKQARIVLGAAAPTPVLAKQAQSLLSGSPLNMEVIEAAAAQAAAEALPISDLRGSAEYRRELVKTLTQRALQSSWKQLEPGY